MSNDQTIEEYLSSIPGGTFRNIEPSGDISKRIAAEVAARSNCDAADFNFEEISRTQEFREEIPAHQDKFASAVMALIDHIVKTLKKGRVKRFELVMRAPYMQNAPLQNMFGDRLSVGVRWVPD
jgi:hypothetical protein